MLRCLVRAQKLPFQLQKIQLICSRNLRNARRAFSERDQNFDESQQSDLKEVTYQVPQKPISQEFSIDQAKSVMMPNKSSTSSLVITEDQTDIIDMKLSDKNFKNLIEKQAEIKNVIRAVESPFLLFYLVDKQHNDFGTGNLTSLLNKLAYFKKLMLKQDSAAVNQVKADLIFPKEIKQIFTRLFLKLSPYFQPEESLNALSKLVKLDCTLEDHSVQSLVQLMKYQVNQLEIHELVYAKQLLNKLADRSSNSEDSFSKELLTNLDKAITLSAKLNQHKLEMYSRSDKSRTILGFVRHFHQSMRRETLEESLKYLSKIPHKEFTLDEIVDLLEIHGKHGFAIYFVLKRLTYSMKHKFEFKSKDGEKKVLVEVIHERMSALVPFFAKQKFYDQELMDMLLPIRLKHYERVLEEVGLANDEPQQKQLSNIIDELNSLYGFCLRYDYQSSGLIDLVNKAYFENRAKNVLEYQEVLKIFRDKFKFKLLKIYVEKCQYTKLTSKDFEDLESMTKARSGAEVFI